MKPRFPRKLHSAPRLYTSGDFLVCPHCFDTFHVDGLNAHIEWAHPDASGLRPSAKQAVEKMEKRLRKIGYDPYRMLSGSPYLLVRHRASRRMIFLKIAPFEEYEEFNNAYGVLLRLERHSLATLAKLANYWERPRSFESNDLGKNVLTSFGWHSGSDEESRQRALLAALAVLKPEHIENILQLLINMWSKQHRQMNIQGARDSLKWFHKTVTWSVKSQRRKLRTSLERDFRTIKRRNILLRKSSNRISGYFVICY